ncbi:MAG: acyltransferase family protein, partial [Acidimicrobiales bacterium]|nr:acyltransferase family protein [Acidimicrobiales bacterium]
MAGVLWFHAGHLTGGYLGVDLFFVLSGYLITSLLVLEWAATGRISVAAFWGRRARRLLPALLAVLVVVGLAAHGHVRAVDRGQLRGEGLATLGYVANWFSIVRGAGYWDRALLPSWLQHTWSLAIEEQFYVLWPLLVVGLFGVTRGPRRRRAADAPPAGSSSAVDLAGRPAAGASAAGTDGPPAEAEVRRAVRRLAW